MYTDSSYPGKRLDCRLIQVYRSNTERIALTMPLVADKF